jgi:hypothetical protein
MSLAAIANAFPVRPERAADTYSMRQKFSAIPQNTGLFHKKR